MSAFTLIEMLIVLMIMMIVMTIAVGAWAGLVDPNTETATRSLMSDLIRQGRQQSLATGRPVVLIIETDPATETAAVTGLAQTRIWSEDFEWNNSTDIASHIDSGDSAHDSSLVPGELYMGTAGYGWRSGVGLRLNAYASDTALVTSPDDGFYLECAVRPANIRTARNADGLPACVIPLMLVTPQGTDDAVEGAVAGIELWRQPLFALWPETDPAGPTCTHEWLYGYQDHWMLVGWVGERPTPPEAPGSDTTPETFDQLMDRSDTIFYDNFDHAAWRSNWLTMAPRTSYDSVGSYVCDFSVMDPKAESRDDDLIFNEHSIAGGEWMRVGMVYDGSTLTLLRSGQIVDFVRLPSEEDGSGMLDITKTELASIEDQPVQVWLARHSADSIDRTAIADLDRCMLTRVGGRQPVRLPSGVTTRELDDPEGGDPVRQRYIITINDGLITISGEPSDTSDAADRLYFTRGSDGATLQYSVQSTGTLTLEQEVP